MAYRNLDFKKGISDIVNDLKEKRSTIYEWTNSKIFTKQFGIFERFDNKVNKLPPAAYDLAKCCVKNYPSFLSLAPYKGKKQEHIKGTDVMKYNKAMLSEIDTLKDFEKEMLLSKPSVKYAKVMNKYYDKLLDGIAQVSTICTDVDGDYSPENVEKILEDLKQLTWHHVILKTLNRTSSNTSQFNINTAFKDVMKELENDDSNDKIYYDKGLQRLKGEEFENKKKEIEDEYYSKLKEKFPENENTQNFYKKLECNTDYDGDYFKNYRNNFILYSLTVGDAQSRELVLRNFLNYIDMYGRLLVPGTLETIDNVLVKYQNLIMLLNSNETIDPKRIPLVPASLMDVHYCGDYFVFNKKMYLLKEEEKEFIKAHQIDKAVWGGELLLTWLHSGSNEDLNKIRKNLEFVWKYFCFCTGVLGWSYFENTKNCCNEHYGKMCTELKNDDVYKDLRKEVDRFIGQKWRHFIFKK